MHHIAVLHDISLSFGPHLSGFLGRLLSAQGDKVVIGNGFSANKPFFKIAVDHASCFWR